jgi:serine/threonine protein kinase/alpha-beta hydrolase superfamily lysophospholipase
MEMNQERWAQVQELFQKALDLNAEQRSALMGQVRAGDSGLEEVVMTLLRAHEVRGPLDASLDEARVSSQERLLGDSEDIMKSVARSLADRYRVEEMIGRGGMAVVYRAHDLRLDRPVALKVMGSGLEGASGAGRFLQEVRLAANLHHPNILSVHDSGEADGHLYYVMPLVGGESLRQRLRREGRFPPEETLEMAAAVAGALDYAHRHEIIHRDVKPDNILFHEDNPLVADFGIALALDTVGDNRLTTPGLLVGTPNYMSPEQVSGSVLDGSTDGYALACVVYECLAGEPPFQGPNALAVASKHIVEPVPTLSDKADGVPPEVDVVFRRGLAKTPGERYTTVGDFVRALREAMSLSVRTISGPRTTVAPIDGIETPLSGPTIRDQEIRFCVSRDGVNIAYASVGEGIPLIKTSNWLSHLEYDWHSPMWRHWWNGLGKRSRLIRYDARGTGLSDRRVEDISLDAWVDDLEAVVDASGVDEFALLGISQGGAIAVEYAVRHPERVSHLILHGAYSRGRLVRSSPEDNERAMLDVSLVKHGWGKENPAFRQVFSTLFMPSATPQQLDWFDEIQRVSVTAENAARIIKACHYVDVRALAEQVLAPTLVLHSTRDARIPFEEGRLLARLIPGARFVPLDSENHIPLGNEPAWPKFLDAVWRFLDQPSGAGSRQ